MKNGKYCIAIMSVGSGIGQSVVTSCNLSRLPIHTVGFDMNPFAFGGYECDEFSKVPSINSEEYILVLIDKCLQYSVDLIIPGLDDEALILSKNINIFNDLGIEVLASGEGLISLARDKEKMCKEFSSYADIFVECFSVIQAQNLYKDGRISLPLIAKPCSGSGSAGIEILLEEEDFNKITTEHIVQEIAIPEEEDPYKEVYIKSINNRKNIQVSEVSIQIVSNKNGDIIGRMMSYNKLKNGVPIEIVPFSNSDIWSQIDLILPKLKELGHKGPLNIQGRITDKGFKIFEINTRFTGITGLRALMGFNEVEACIIEWLKLGGSKPLEINYDRFGVRQVKDKVLPMEYCEKAKSILNYISRKEGSCKKTILITGANGYLGQALIKRLNTEDYIIMALGKSTDILNEMYKALNNVSCYSFDDLYNGILQLGQVDCLIHCAFARPNRSNEEIAESLKFTNELLSYAGQNQVPEIINISSQSVYGNKNMNGWTEEDKPAPETAYSQAKFAAELFVDSMNMSNKHVHGTSLRLATLTGGQDGLTGNELFTKLITKVINNESIKIYDGKQKIERLDILDAADAIAALLKTDCRKWGSKYNLSTGKTFELDEIIDTIISIAKDEFGYDPAVIRSNILRIESNGEKSSGMNNKQFTDLTGWESNRDLRDTIISIFNYLLKPDEVSADNSFYSGISKSPC